MKTSACRGCGAEIIWTITSGGKKMPVDAEPDPDGMFVLEWDDDAAAAFAIHVRAGDLGGLADGDRYTSHFATCPNANSFRGRQ
jgi:hypothetical protein